MLNTMKRLRSSLNCAVLAVIIPSAALVQAQDASRGPFTLFEPVESPERQENNASTIVPRNNQASSGNGPIFVLVGTSRIGDSRSAIVRHSSGEEVVVPLREFGATPIPGYESFNVVGADGGNLSIRYPASSGCADFSSQGVTCSSEGNIALLSLTTAAPVVRREPEPEQESSADADGEAEEPGNRNPFAVLRERAMNGDAQAGDQDNASRRFRPRRIDPADVPPGMRVVSTPFGDRLVEL